MVDYGNKQFFHFIIDQIIGMCIQHLFDIKMGQYALLYS